MKQNIKTKLIFQLLLLATFSGLAVANAKIANPEATEQILHKEQIERQEQRLNAELLIKKANKNFQNKSYEVAKGQCLQAITILSKISPPNKATEAKIIKVRDMLAMIYTYWANDISKQAETSADSGKLEEAMALSRQAAEMNPNIKPQSNKQIEEFERKIKQTKYEDLISESASTPENNKRLYNIDVLYEQGKKLLNSKDYSRAKEKFEELLVLDPYNTDAIQYLKVVNDQIYYAGQERDDATFNKRIAEVQWSYIKPIVAKTSSGNRIDTAVTIPIPKDQSVDIIQKKLDEIIIKHIAFEEVPVKTAMMFLQRESKKLDPEGKGINIFLMINEEPAKEAAETAEDEESWDEGESSLDEEELLANEYLITLLLDNVPLGKAIEYVCAAAGLNYNVGNYAVEVFSSNVTPAMETVVFPVEQEHYTKVSTADDGSTVYTTRLEAFFSERGVDFPEGASAIYDSKVSRLIARNTPAAIRKISEILTKLKTNTPQVSISAKFIELEQKDFEELGFEWRTSNEPADPPTNATTWQKNDQINRFALVDGASAKDAKYDRVFGLNYTSPEGFTLDAVIHALDQNEKVNLLSAPKVTTLSGQKATIKMTSNIYYPVSWSEPTLTEQTFGIRLYVPPAPEFEEPTENGIIFQVTPFVEPDHYTIDLEMEPQVRQFIGWVDYSYQVTDFDGNTFFPNLKMPQFKLQNIQTHLKIYDGETVVMGGVAKDNTDSVDDRTPILGDIPVVGRFFRSQYEDAEKISLLIFTKVDLVRPDGSMLRPKVNDSLPDFD